MKIDKVELQNQLKIVFLTCQTGLKLLFVTEKQLFLDNIRNDAT